MMKERTVCENAPVQTGLGWGVLQPHLRLSGASISTVVYLHCLRPSRLTAMRAHIYIQSAHPRRATFRALGTIKWLTACNNEKTRREKKYVPMKPCTFRVYMRPSGMSSPTLPAICVCARNQFHLVTRTIQSKTSRQCHVELFALSALTHAQPQTSTAKPK